VRFTARLAALGEGNQLFQPCATCMCDVKIRHFMSCVGRKAPLAKYVLVCIFIGFGDTNRQLGLVK
jgi:hypothetical protein